MCLKKFFSKKIQLSFSKMPLYFLALKEKMRYNVVYSVANMRLQFDRKNGKYLFFTTGILLGNSIGGFYGN